MSRAAQEIGTESGLSKEARAVLKALEAEKRLKPSAVLEHARNKKSPLHRYFTWDDGEAAEKWRLEEARRIIVEVKVSVQVVNSEPIVVRAYSSSLQDRATGRGYISSLRAMSDVQQREALLETALAELDQFRRKYRHLSELAEVIKAIDRRLRDR